MTGTTARFLVGDVFDRLADIPDGSVDLVLTSPPFLALRSYLPADHPDKAKEIGSEPTPAEFIDTLLALTAAWERVLAPHGSIAVELGDTYSGSGGGGGDYLPGGLRDGQAQFAGAVATARESNAAHWRQKNTDRGAWPDAKSACLIPELYRVALAYGINPLTGESSPAGRWRVRNTVRWVRPNPPVGALGDKYRPATSDMVVACKAKDRWFDLDAVRTEHAGDYTNEAPTKPNREADRTGGGRKTTTRDYVADPAGAPPLDWWNIPTAPYKGSHYATFPPELCRIPILSMCPTERCHSCGTPRQRITERTPEYAAIREAVGDFNTRRDGINDRGTGNNGDSRSADLGSITSVQNVTIGWSDCGCDSPDYRPGTVLDPFAGSGTTLAAAIGHGRNAVGIDLDERNADLARERVGMFLEIDYGKAAA